MSQISQVSRISLSQRSQVSGISSLKVLSKCICLCHCLCLCLGICSLNVFLIVFVFVFVFVIISFLFRSCLLISLIKCLKGHKSLGLLFSVVKPLIVSGVRGTDQGTRSPIELLWAARNTNRETNKKHLCILMKSDNQEDVIWITCSSLKKKQIWKRYHYNQLDLIWLLASLLSFAKQGSFMDW